MTRRPDILVIMADQLRRDALGAYGCDWIPTPNLDRLAAEGVTFEAATCDNPICTPSRASILTGKTVPGHGVRRVHDVLPDDEVLFPERLRREGGYRTALVGKLHVSGRVAEERVRHPNDGFETYDWCLDPTVGLDSRFNAYAAWLRTRAPEFLAALRRDGRGLRHHPEALHTSAWAAERTIELLAADDGRPVFCLMSLFDPHDPYDDHPAAARALIDPARIPPPLPGRAGPAAVATVARERAGSYLGRVEDFSEADIREIRHGYAASVAFADRQIGRVLDALDASGRAADTLVVFLSDHGDQLGDHGLLVKGAPLYEPTVGIPLVVRWPGHVGAGQRCRALVQGRDVAATCLAAAGLDPAACPEAEDLVAVARAGRTRRRAAVCAYRNSGIADGGAPWDPPMLTTMVRDGRHKLVVSASGATVERELYDLDADPGEQVDRAGDPGHAAAESFLTAELVAFLLAETAAAPPRAAAATPGAGQLVRNRLRRAAGEGG